MSSKKKSQQREEFKQEDVIQAVVIADSFNVRFAPITLSKPRTLLPLANVPLLDYTLEFLCTGGVQDIIVFCCNHADQVKQHLRSSKWLSEGSPCEVKIVSSEDSLSLGDALRDIDAKGLIKSDFILVNGDMVANMDLKEVIDIHKARRLKEKTPIMTMVFKEAQPGHRTRSREEEVILAINSDNNRVLHYQKVGTAKKFVFPLNIFQENSDLAVRYDLLDCHLSICSPQMPFLYTENFDYCTRDDFVKGILINEEILGNTIHVHMISDKYAARVSNIQMYDAVSKDVINRWSYPFVPDCNITNLCQDKYSYGRHNIYLHKDVTLARGCVLEEDVVIGQGSSIGSNANISHTVIGKNCHIGKNAVLEGAYIWDNVCIGDGCVVMKSILADEVCLLENTTVQQGSVLAKQVKVGPDISLSPGTVLTAAPIEDEFGEVQNDELKPELIGSGGMAYVYSQPADSDDEVDDLAQDLWGLNVHSGDEDVQSDVTDSDAEGSHPGSPVQEDSQLFYEEVISTLERALLEDINKENMVLEINSLKAAYFMQIKEVNVLLTKALLYFPLKDEPNLEAGPYFSKFNKLMESKFKPLLENYIRNRESQQDCLTSVEDLSLVTSPVNTAIVKILHWLYDEEILAEDAILKWYHNLPQEADNLEDRRALRGQVQKLVTWLQEADEESEESD